MIALTKRTLLSGFLALAFLSASALGAPLKRVLILTGSSNHKWQETTPVLKKILEDTGTFQVDVVEDPALLADGRLGEYEVLLSNWNNWKKKKSPPWSEALRTAYVDFVRQGGGHVMVHSGSSSFSDWKEYQQICCATWELGVTGHGPKHTFDVRPPPGCEHPLAAGLEPFQTLDELWNRSAVQATATVVAEAFSATDPKGTGKWEPIALADQFGKGRCFALMLGHQASFMENPGFQELLRRGTQWVAGDTTSTISVRESDDSLTCSIAGHPLWQFNHSKAEGKPYFHPLTTTAGTLLSDLRPKDHPWHRGLWFSWKLINGINYWEESRKTGLSEGTTKLLHVERTVGTDQTAILNMQLAYAPAGGADVMSEACTITIHPPDADGIYRIDWDGAFTAGAEDVVLDRTPLPPDPHGKPFGGYAGFSLRTPRPVEKGTFLNSEGQENNNRMTGAG